MEINYKKCEHYKDSDCDCGYCYHYEEYDNGYGTLPYCSVQQTGCTCDYLDLQQANSKLDKIKEFINFHCVEDCINRAVLEIIESEE